jgi:hypothetical protein
VVDDLIRKLENTGIKVQAFADDIILLVIGKDGSTLKSLMQQGLNLIARWCTEQGLSVNPAKTVIVSSLNKSRKRKK